MNLFIDKLCIHLTIPSQPDYSTTVFLVFFPVLFVVAIVWWVRKIRAVEEMDGIWYCRELKIQISLADPNNAFLVQSGEKIQCRCEKEATKHNIGMIDVFCREWNIRVINTEKPFLERIFCNITKCPWLFMTGRHTGNILL